MNALLALLPLLPGVLAILALAGRIAARGVTVGVLVTALLAILVAALNPGPLELPWLLLDTTLATDATGAPLLVAAALLWVAAATSARSLFAGDGGALFASCFLFTFAGNLGVLIAQDVAAFYLFFAVMTFAAYGLVIHDRTREAVRAGRIYLVLAVAGECLLLSGFFLLAAEAGNPVAADMDRVYADLERAGLVGGLFLAGFAVKMGLIPVHVWLPLAHPTAPVPASAVLSGIIVKGGLLGWLRFLPEAEPALAAAGDTLAAVGLASAFLAALVGCFQKRAKTVLAYSTISQMGLLAVPVGLLIAGRGEAPVLLAVIAVFATHHALAKGALFLAMDHIKAGGRAMAMVMVLPALAIAGAPVTSGLVAKAAVKSAVPDPLPLLITFTSVTTTLLLARFLVLAWPSGAKNAGAIARVAIAAWLLVIAAGQLLPWTLAGPAGRAYAFQAGALWDAVWPLALGIGGAVLAARMLRPWRVLPEGDIVVPVERGVIGAYAAAVRAATALSARRPALPQDIPWRQLAGRLLPHREPDIPWVGVQMLVLVLLLSVIYLLAG
ncbi:complex I subunit 5 family protein [Aquisalimonas sp.]|uniref:complex I subunit 5 family protein n=1 Tax=Aquisalimonas sp. TaxID=1872621 RepID=UPI0025BF35DC|nr:complex I subunit 5 family protein [Aquisalimonas sp.]